MVPNFTNDYSGRIILADHARELRAEAAAYRLAREARQPAAPRPGLVHRVIAAGRLAAAALRTGSGGALPPCDDRAVTMTS